MGITKENAINKCQSVIRNYLPLLFYELVEQPMQLGELWLSHQSMTRAANILAVASATSLAAKTAASNSASA